MRLWSLHPSFLDAKGLVALWREALLAQHVLYGKTKGYRHHPQLQRFRDSGAACEAIATYLCEVQEEASRRGYAFDRQKILRKPAAMKIKVTNMQMAFELEHLYKKLQGRDPEHLGAIAGLKLRPHPLFKVVPGGIEAWERLKSD